MTKKTNRGQVPDAPEKVIEIALSDLHFDPENPRLPVVLRRADDGRILEWMLAECSVIELMLSIGAQGFFAGEPVLVVKREGGGFTVVEGNRRLAATKLLADDAEAPVMAGQVKDARSVATVRPAKLPALVFEDRRDILRYLGFRHITGINEWDALAKARYLKQLRDEFHSNQPAEQQHRELAREIGSRADYIAKLLTGLMLLDKAKEHRFFDKQKLKEDDIPFSLLTTALSYGDICKFVGLQGATDTVGASVDPKPLLELMRWVYVADSASGNTVIGESRNLRKLAKVVVHPKALERLRQGKPLEEAFIFTDGPLVGVRILLSEAEDKLTSAQESLRFIDRFEPGDLERATELHRLTGFIRVGIEGTLIDEKKKG